MMYSNAVMFRCKFEREHVTVHYKITSLCRHIVTSRYIHVIIFLLFLFDARNAPIISSSRLNRKLQLSNCKLENSSFHWFGRKISGQSKLLQIFMLHTLFGLV